MATLYLDRRGAALDVEAGSLTVRLGGEIATRIPLAPLERVVLRGEAVLSTRVLAELWRHDIGLLLLSGRHGEATARLVGRPHDDVALRLAQYRRASDAAARDEAARAIVAAKLAAEGRLLGRALEVRPDRRKPLPDAIASLERVQARIAKAGEGLDRNALNGLEGAGAAAYFRAYATLFPDALGFARRRRRPPPDPVNVCLSLGYTLLHHEPVRPHVDEWVWRRFAGRELRLEHFSHERGGGCLLGKAGRRLFYDAFEPFCAGLRRLLRRMARGLAADLRRSAAA